MIRMFHRLMLAASLGLVVATASSIAAAQPPQRERLIILADMGNEPLVAGEVAATNTAASDPAAHADLVRRAEPALRVKPPSVTHKSRLAPSGSPNDYASTAPYYFDLVSPLLPH